MSAEKMAKLVRMANQIGDYFRTLPEAEAVASTADHLRRFWTPKMLGEIVAFAASRDTDLNPIAARAVAELAKPAEPEAIPRK
jgi:formate dehydrogenase subunit delta